MESTELAKSGEVPEVERGFREEAESCRITFAVPESKGGVAALSDLDRLDRLTLVVLLVLLVSAVGIILVRPGEDIGPAGTQTSQAHQNMTAASPEFTGKMATAVNLLNGGDPTRAGQLLDSLIVDYPYEGGPHMLKGDLLLRQQQPIGAMLEFRQGVDLNPDYLDKKMTDVFQGKKVKNTLEEARMAIVAGLARTPGDATLKQQREVLYYMLRKVAGSCG